MRRNWKRFGAMLMALVMVLSLVPTAALAARITDDAISIDAPGAEEAAHLAEAPAQLMEVDATTATYDYPLTNAMVSASSEKNPPGYVNDGYVYWAIDYNDAHWWHQQYDTDEDIWFQFSLPAEVTIAGIRYQKRTDGNTSYFGEYKIQTSTDGSTWTDVSGETGTWGNDNNLHGHTFATPITTRYIRVAGGNVRNRTAKNFHLVLDDSGRTTVSGTVKNGDTLVANATVQVYCNGQASYKVATTNDQGAYSIVLPRDSQGWKLSVSNEGLMAVATVTTSEAAITQDLALTSPTRTISGTVTTNGTTPLAGAKVMLVGTAANHYPVVSGIEAVTDSNGVYNLNVNTVPAGTYNIRVFKEDRGATIIAEPFQITATEVTEEITGKNAQLPEYADYADEGYDIKSFDFTSADGINLVKLAGDNATVTPAIADGVLKLTYTQDGNSAAATRDKNFVLIGGTPMMNGEIEFDATRQNGNRRFGLTFRMQNDTQHMIYVGQFLGSSAWGHEHWNGSGNNVWSDGNADYSANVPSFGAGETRHFKIKISGEQVSLWIDGVEIFADKYLSKGDGSAAVANKTPVMTAGSVGFAYGGTDGSLDGSGTWNETITIDNLRVVRFDPAFAVTVDDAVANGTLNVTNNNIAQGETWDKSRTSEGDVIVVSGTGDTGYALNAVSVTKADDSQTTITPTLNANGTFQFTMPAYAVTVSGTFLPKVTGVTIDTSNGLKVGKTVTANVAPADADGKVTYQWQHENTANDGTTTWVNCTNATDKTKTISDEDSGKRLQVIVTGDGEHYANTVSVTSAATAATSPADVEVTGVSIARSQITMWMNDSVTATTGDSVGKTTTLTATIDPANATSPRVAWSIENPSEAGVIELATVAEHPEQQTVTAAKNGTATVKVTVTSADGTTHTDTVAIAVKTNPETIAVKNGSTAVTEAAPLVLYTNTNVAGKPNSADLTLDITPTTASEKGFTWLRTDGAEGLINVVRKENDNTQATISVTGISETNVGEKIVEVKSTSDATVKTTFKVIVRRYLENDVSVSGDLKYGATLTADTNQLVVAGGDDGKAKLTYQWYKGEAATEENKIADATGKTLVINDANLVGSKVTVVVTATPTADFFYEGSKTATSSAVIGKADGPDVPTAAHGEKVQSSGASDGKIVGLRANEAYKLSSDNGSTWQDQTANAEGKIEGLAAGSYVLKVAETSTHAEGPTRNVLVPTFESDLATVSINEASLVGLNITRTPAQAAAGQAVTFTVTAKTGYVLTENSIKVSKADGTAISHSATSNANEYTFNMTDPAEALTISAQFTRAKIRISHNLTNLTCSLGESGTDHVHEVEYGAVHSITFTAPASHNLPNNVTITKGSGTEAFTAYSYNNGVITFNEGGLTEDITITAAGVIKTYAVNYSLTAGGLTGSDRTGVEHGSTYTGTLTANTGFEVPASITVTMGGTALTSGYTYTPAANKAAASIEITNVTGNVVITAAGVKQKTQVTAVTISGNNYQVATTLSANTTPAEAQVDYQWYRVKDAQETPIGTNQRQYTLTTADIGATIKVKVTGKGDYTGTPTSTAVGPVIAQIIEATGVTISAPAGSENTVVFGQTLQLTAAVTPTNATAKTVKWSVVSGDAATVNADTGVVTPVKVGTVTIRATVLRSDGTNGVTNTISIAVTAAPVSVTLTGTAQVGQPLTATFTPSGVTASDFHSVTWFRLDGTNDGAGTQVASGVLTYTPVAADAGYQIKVTASEATGNYAGSPSATSVAVLPEGAEAPTYVITIADSEHGAVTADKASAAAGEKVTLTITPDAGYELDTLTITDNLTIAADNSFVMPAKAVAISATFKKIAITGVTLDKETASVQVGKTTTLTAAIAPEGAAGELEWTSGDEAIATVANGVVTGVAEGEAVITVKVTGTDFTDTCTVTVTKASSSSGSSSSRPSTSTETTTNPDGSKTTTVTDNRTGTVTATTEKPDGTKEVVETKKDGTVTETVTAPDGAKTEKVTTKDGDVAITATDAEGETIAKVEIPAEVPAPEAKFEDIDQAPWAEEAINKVAGLKLVEGTGDNKYAPVAPMTRGALATVLHRLSQGKTNYNATFQDVAEGKYYTEGVAWAAKAGVVKGFSADIFAPEQVITREQLAVMLARYAKVIGLDSSADVNVLKNFTDGDTTGAWAVDGMAWCVANGILQGKGNSTLAPTAQVTRAEVAVMLDRFIALIK